MRKASAKKADKIKIGSGKHVGGTGRVGSLMHAGIAARGHHDDRTREATRTQRLEKRSAVNISEMMIGDYAIKRLGVGCGERCFTGRPFHDLRTGKRFRQRVARQESIVLTVIYDEEFWRAVHGALDP